MQLRLESKTFYYQVETKPGVICPFAFTFKDNLPFSISLIKWSYSIPSSVNDGYGWPKTPLEVTVDNICEAERGCPVQLTTPVVARSVTGSVKNFSHLPVNLCIQFQGSLVVGDVSHLTDEQIAIYTSLDGTQRALLSLPQLGQNLLGLPTTINENAEPKALPTSDCNALLLGDLFEASGEGLVQVEKIKQLSEHLLKKGWRR